MGGLMPAMAVVLLPASAQAANNAQYLGDTIPATMIPGFSYNVSVTMKNTGTTTWTKAEGYSLGAVGDSDPFAPGQDRARGRRFDRPRSGQDLQLHHGCPQRGRLHHRLADASRERGMVRGHADQAGERDVSVRRLPVPRPSSGQPPA